MRSGGTLSVVREAKLADLLAVQRVRDPSPKTLEGSGVAFAEDRLWVVFDNLAEVASLDPALETPDPTAGIVSIPADLRDLEDIAYDATSGHFFLVVEGRQLGSGPPVALVAEFDVRWQLVARKPVDVPLVRANKGIEGLTCVRRADRTYLLALSEGNRGLAGKAGRRFGGGRVHVLAEQDECWRPVDTIHLPHTLRFRDYAGISVAADRVAVVSQQSSAIWVGRLAPDRWDIVDDGVTHEFPRSDSGRVVYTAIEGVSWLTERTLAAVSDRATDQRRLTPGDKEQAVHIVELPADRP